MPLPDPTAQLPAPMVVAITGDNDDMLSREYLVANKLGGYAAASILGANTRRYHGLLVGSGLPPAERIVTLSCLHDRFVPEDGGEAMDLTTFEFEGVLRPDARPGLVEFRNDVAATFVYRRGAVELVKEVFLPDTVNAVLVRYRQVAGPAGTLTIRPFLAMRDFHAVCSRDRRRLVFDREGPALRIWAEGELPHELFVRVGALDADGSYRAGGAAAFLAATDWWLRFRYRADLERGQEGYEDLYTPGEFSLPLAPQAPVQLTASLDEPRELRFQEVADAKARRLGHLAAAVGATEEPVRRLAVAADAYLVARRRNSLPGMSILAGFPWFLDWGRDAMIALPGLLLETRRFDAARQVLRTFAAAVDDGMIPNRFDDYGGPPHFNSIDASLWFIVAADRYAAASGDEKTWRDELAPVVESILRHYHDGTRFDIHADADGLISGGHADTQLTWMDAKFAGLAITPRWGKCVEINALWHHALRIAARRAASDRRRDEWQGLADRAAAAFGPTFWNQQLGCLYDCVGPYGRDATIRPNQVLAVALPDCPLPGHQQADVLEVVGRELLTPYGLRTLAPHDARYRGRYGSSWESRDRSYHQGCVWAWLIGPFVEAYLRVHDFSPAARFQCRQFLQPLLDHLPHAGVGQVSEIFDGDAPHTPHACVAQAWSVAEVLRALGLVRRGAEAT